MKDWKNQPVTKDESPDDMIKAWRVEDSHEDIHGYTSIVVRSLEELWDTIDAHLEGYDEDELRDGIELTITLKEMRLGDYEELPE